MESSYAGAWSRSRGAAGGLWRVHTSKHGLCSRPPPPLQVCAFPTQNPFPSPTHKNKEKRPSPSPSPSSCLPRPDPQGAPPRSRSEVQSSDFGSKLTTQYQHADAATPKNHPANGSFTDADDRPLPVPLPSQQQVLRAPHLQDHLGSLRDHVNPLMHSQYFHPGEGFWLSETDMVAQNIAVDIQDPSSHTQTFFLRAGPRYHVKFASDEVRAAVVTCGGLCPGLNTVVREIVDALWYQYGVRNIFGIEGAYRGFYSSEPVHLDPRKVDHWHSCGGTKLGTSRGGFDLKKIVDAIESHRFNQVYIIGGDGTMKGAVALFEEVKRRKLKVSVVGLPKTVDNDVGVIDRSFGFQTAVEKAREAVIAAHVEAESTPNGLGLVKLMGRNAGHIALHATLGSRDVDCCLIPEVSFFMDGPGGLLDFVEERLSENGHCVLVVAEGAGLELMQKSDASNETHTSVQDIGVWLGDYFKDWWKKKHPTELFALKYIDPTYMIRAVPSNAADTAYCTLLSHSALHGAMAGYTGFVAGPINGRFCYIPLDLVANTKHLVNLNDHTWGWVKSINNQPDFTRE